MTKSSLCLAATTALVSLGLTQPSKAQMDGPFPNLAPSTMNTYMSSRIGNLSLQDSVKGATTRGPRTSNSASKGKTPGTASTSYRATPAVTQKVINQYITWARTQSPSQAELLKEQFAHNNPIQVWSSVVKADGLKTGDIADSLAAYWIINYLMAHQTLQSTRTQALAVRNQARAILARNPAIARLPQTQRQEISELWMLNFVVQQGTFGEAWRRHDKVLLKKLADAAVTRFQSEMGLNLRKVTLTNQGFVLHT